MSEFSIKKEPIKIGVNKDKGAVVNSFMDTHQKRYSVSRIRRKKDERESYRVR